MKVYRCKYCKFQPILFEGEFLGKVQKICPKCKTMNLFENYSTNKKEKIC